MLQLQLLCPAPTIAQFGLHSTPCGAWDLGNSRAEFGLSTQQGPPPRGNLLGGMAGPRDRLTM